MGLDKKRRQEAREKKRREVRHKRRAAKEEIREILTLPTDQIKEEAKVLEEKDYDIEN